MQVGEYQAMRTEVPHVVSSVPGPVHLTVGNGVLVLMGNEGKYPLRVTSS